jgi:hypothetical protein
MYKCTRIRRIQVSAKESWLQSILDMASQTPYMCKCTHIRRIQVSAKESSLQSLLSMASLVGAGGGGGGGVGLSGDEAGGSMGGEARNSEKSHLY